MEQVPTRDGFLSLLGRPPERVPLAPQVLSEQELDSHTLKLIEYATVPGECVQAYLLLPHGDAACWPGALAIHQDGGDRPYQFGGE
jgi:hypothetical protein